jgi:acetyltransferase
VAVPASVTLRDGTVLRFAPLRATDTAMWVEAFEHLSEQSRHNRFLVTVDHPSERMIDQLVRQVDGYRHVALVGRIDDRPVVIARYVRLPGDGRTAELAITVADEWQGRGVGSAAAAVLGRHALDHGVTRLTGSILRSNTAILHLMAGMGALRIDDESSGLLEVSVDLLHAPEDDGVRLAFDELRLRRHPELDEPYPHPTGTGKSV